MQRVLIVAVLLLVVGLGVIINFGHGGFGFGVGFPLAGTNVHFDMTTTGLPALVGTPLVVVGALLLAIAFLAAIAAQFSQGSRADRVADLPPRREGPFAE